MRAVVFLMMVAIMGSTALVIRNRSRKRVSRQEPVTPPTTDCICVEYNQCNNNYTLNKYGFTLIDIRKIGPCDHYLHVCCKKENDGKPVELSTSSPLPDLAISTTTPSSSLSKSPLLSAESSSSWLPNPSTTNNINPSPTDSASISSPLPNQSITLTPSSSSALPSSPTNLQTSDSQVSTSPEEEDPDSLKTPPKPVKHDRYTSRGCGFRNQYGVGFRIIGGKSEAQFGEFPWVVAVLKDDATFICGGSLIHPKVVLTAAHCVRGKFMEKLVARAGEWDRGTTKEVLPYQDRRIAEVIEHKDYHSGGLMNNLALLILKEPMKLADNVDTICLPAQNYNFDHSNCVASGWGKDDFNSKKEQVILKKVNLPIVPRDTCGTILRKTRLGNYFKLHDSFICAGGKKGQDTCQGDGGSPLMCPLKDDPERYEQAGIVSWGIGCGDVIPGVYASVARFRDWIQSELGERGIII